MKVKVMKLYDESVVPTRGSEYAAGYDLYCYDARPEWEGREGKKSFFTIKPHTTQKIGTGIAMAIPDGYVGLLFARSGLATKQGLRPANCVGVIDSDYRGEIIVALHNDTDEDKHIEHNERIAQLVIMPYPEIEYELTDKLDDTERGDGGFGHTGK